MCMGDITTLKCLVGRLTGLNDHALSCIMSAKPPEVLYVDG